MRALSAPELLSVWERGQAQPPVQRTLTLLAAACPGILPDALAELSIGQRDARLLTLREWTFGPQLVTTDEIEDVSALKVATVINGRVHAENIVANMTFSPAFLVSFLSSVMTLLPGDIISTGTPGATVIADRDVVESRIAGFATLANPVRDLKMAHQ